MAELFKHIYNRSFFQEFVVVLQEIEPQFDTKQFLVDIFADEWDDLELKQRMRRISTTLHKYLSGSVSERLQTILGFVKYWQQKGKKQESIEFMFLPDYIELYGLDSFVSSVQTFEKLTPFTSCEFAVRPFIVKYPNTMMSLMEEWTHHENHHVRRLASEGCRPRLPWAMALLEFKKNPAPIVPILENLKDDDSEYVRRSVANNLNDIAKDNPDIVIKIAKQWYGQSKETDWVVKHACRTLLKQGNIDVLQLFGFGSPEDIIVQNMEVRTPIVQVGEELEFAFELENQSSMEVKIRLEYALYYMKSNGTLSRKVFKISEKVYEGSSLTHVVRKQPFKIITTRKLYEGEHQVAVIINGKEYQKNSFYVKKDLPKI